MSEVINYQNDLVKFNNDLLDVYKRQGKVAR